jgi:hypothetical protein
MSDKPMTPAEKAKALQASVEKHHNKLYDAAALLAAAADRIDESTDDGQHTFRLLQMAYETVNEAAGDLSDLV